MSTDLIGYVYSVVIIVGGVMGFVTKVGTRANFYFLLYYNHLHFRGSRGVNNSNLLRFSAQS